MISFRVVIFLQLLPQRYRGGFVFQVCDDLSNRSVFANNLVDVHFVPYVCRAPLHGELSKIFLSVHDRR